MKTVEAIFLAALSCVFAGPATAQTEIAFWHAFSGALGDIVDGQIADFNDSQADFAVVATRKGNYAETLRAGLDAFRAGEQPDLLMVFDVGSHTMVNTPGLVRPVHQIMAASDATFDVASYIPGVAGYYTASDGRMLAFPFNSSTPVLWVNRDALAAAEIDPDVDLSTWEQVDAVLGQLKASGHSCPLTSSWQSWIHVENFAAYHDVPFASRGNGFDPGDAQLTFNGPAVVAHIDALNVWAQDERFIYAGRRNEAGARFRAGLCALFTDSSAAYASIEANAAFDFDVRPLPYWDALVEAPQNTIVGGAALWALEGQTQEDYAAIAAFLAFLSSADVQAKWHLETGYLPITQEAARLSRAEGVYAERPGAEVAITQVSTEALTANSRGIRLGALNQIRGVLDEELEAVWAADKDAQTALDDAKRRGDAILRRVDRFTR